MTTIDIRPWCDVHRIDMKNGFKFSDGRVMATNGKVLICLDAGVPFVGACVVGETDVPKLWRAAARFVNTHHVALTPDMKWRAAPVWSVPPTPRMTCPCCQGEALVGAPCWECWECWDAGEVEDPVDILLPSMVVDWQYYRLIHDLPNVEIADIGVPVGAPLPVRFTGGCALIMPLRSERPGAEKFGNVAKGAGMSLAPYQDLLARKRVAFAPRGLARVPDLNAGLFPHQRAVTAFLLTAGCGAAFLDTGLGKTVTALEWARCIVEATNRPVLMLAPLAVGPQHAREAVDRGIAIAATYVRSRPARLAAQIYITNYERLHLFDPADFAGVVLDESSILKSFTGATTRALIEAFARTPYRLACTATPAPNDHTELGQHSAFLGVMDSPEMLARWFLADQTQMGRYRLKRPAIGPFWDWVASWARCVSKPSDLGFSDDGFVLPELMHHEHVVRADRTVAAGADRDGQSRLFRIPETSATSIHAEKRLTSSARADALAAAVAAEPAEPWVIWCDTNDEADQITARIPGAVEVRGSMTAEQKEERLIGFSEGRVRVIVTKPSIAGFGLNWQHCARVGFVGLSFSYESYYQAVRRCWRFGQTRPVAVHVAMADTERAIFQAVSRKKSDHDEMKSAMAAAMARAARTSRVLEDYVPTRRVQLPDWIKERAA